MALNTVSGLATDVTISGFETADRLAINGLGGDDVIVVQERRLSQIYRLERGAMISQPRDALR